MVIGHEKLACSQNLIVNTVVVNEFDSFWHGYKHFNFGFQIMEKNVNKIKLYECIQNLFKVLLKLHDIINNNTE